MRTLHDMVNPIESTRNDVKLAQLEAALQELARLVLRRGFFGTASVELSVQDGTIQSIRSRLERLER